MLGAFLSALIEEFISDEKLAKLIPENKLLATILGIFLGFFLPTCDCAVIPLTKRLLKKNVPIHVVISFMLASPIINPVVLFSTYTAFYSVNPKMFWARLLCGIIIAFIIGLIMGLIFQKKENISLNTEEHDCKCKSKATNPFISIIKHTAYDFFDVLKYLLMGALLASLVQVFLPQNVFYLFQENKILSIITLMLFAYLISLCSTSDSFIGKSLLSTFSNEAVLAYLLLGPMIDIKNTIVLLGNYEKKFTAVLITLIFIIIFIVSVVIPL